MSCGVVLVSHDRALPRRRLHADMDIIPARSPWLLPCCWLQGSRRSLSFKSWNSSFDFSDPEKSRVGTQVLRKSWNFRMWSWKASHRGSNFLRCNLYKVEKLIVALASVIGASSLISTIFWLLYTSWQTVNDIRIGHDCLGFTVPKSPEKVKNLLLWFEWDPCD